MTTTVLKIHQGSNLQGRRRKWVLKIHTLEDTSHTGRNVQREGPSSILTLCIVRTQYQKIFDPYFFCSKDVPESQIRV